MGRRTFLPGLRSTFGRAPAVRTAPDPPMLLEAKTISIGYGHRSLFSGRTVYDGEDRAAGWDMERAVDGFEAGLWINKCVDRIATDGAGLPLRVGLDDDATLRQIVDEHPLDRALNKRSNPLERGAEFKYRLFVVYLLSKRGAFVEVTKNRRGEITRLDLLPSDRVVPVPDDRNGRYVKHFAFTDRMGRLRELPPSKVRWIRKPHPTDPFCGVTPLEAAGLSHELDQGARQYNVAFLHNDGRPGGVLGVHADGLNDTQLDRIESRMAPGPQNAGRITAFGTGTGGMTYIDTAARPRDMAYGDMAKISKDEILAAFGVPESVLGNASGRTYDNAEQEEYNYWALTMLGHLAIIAAAFDEDAGDEWNTFFDTSRVEALELPRRRALAALRQDFEAGLITIDEYRAAAGRNPFDNPHSRALWISPQKAPVPARPEDAEALGVEGPGGSADGQDPAGDPNAPAPGVDAPPGEDTPAGPAAAAVAQARAGSTTTADNGPAAAAVDAARAGSLDSTDDGPAHDAVDAARGMETKTAKGPQDVPGFDVGDEAITRTEMAVAAALDALLARQAGVVVARLRSPKARKGTPWWEPSGPEDTRGGDGPLPSERIADAGRWAEETEATVRPILEKAAGDTAQRMITAFAAQGLFGTAPPVVPPAATLVAATAAAVAAKAVAALTALVAAEISAAAALPGATIDSIAEAVTAFYEGMTRRARPEALAAAVTAVNGTAQVLAEALARAGGSPRDDVIVRTWVTRRDAAVRPTHRAAHGARLRVDRPFEVGGSALMYPGDPLAPLRETAGCRCRLIYHVVPAGRRLVLPDLATEES